MQIVRSIARHYGCILFLRFAFSFKIVLELNSRVKNGGGESLAVIANITNYNLERDTLSTIY